MKNIILQHWTGDMNELTERSVDNISKYAKKVNADYELLRGNVFRPNLTPPCQKVYMLDEVFDGYDMVVMLDADMFTRKGMNKNVFEDVEGVGRHTKIQDQLVDGLKKRFPSLGNPEYSYWGGSIYRLDKKLRKTLRSHIREDEIIKFSGDQTTFQDEGIMHRLAVLAQIKNRYLPDNRWNCGNFEEEVNDCSIIHIRKRMVYKGAPTPKMKIYRHLVKKGLIEE